MESLLEAELYKKEPTELAQVMHRLTILIRDVLQKGDTSRAKELEAEKRLVTKVWRTKDRPPTDDGEE